MYRHWASLLAWLLLGLVWSLPSHAAEYQPLPPAATPGLAPDEWLLHDAAGNRLILYLPGYHAPAHTYYQWVRFRPRQPFVLSFAAAPGLSIFLDNQLQFTAPTAGRFSLDLAAVVPASQLGRPHLLAVWQPDGYPALSSFGAAVSVSAQPTTPAMVPAAQLPRLQLRLPAGQGTNVLLVFLLVLGLLYGVVRSTYPAGLARILQVNELFGSSTDPQNFLARPAFTWLNMGLVLLFSFSLALLLTALHTDFSSLPLFQQVFDVPESAIVARVFVYTSLILSFVLGKYLLVELLSYIFDLRLLVNLHYREFLRTTLLLGLLLPLVLLLYLGLNARWPGVVGLANGCVLLLLTVTVLRVARTLHHRASLLNLHLFAYLCATEVLPLAVLLKLIVFTYPA
ncbi:DUF4271 domain-containing protein [Hymenobacter sp. BRD128]|uniref:DUF4271 domain-containing protein n=1 Tax=Hymenobacter sp. BRD128 TaxID=2675878 RepID=UPI00156447AB|nr:DUF4271 domain-containing protein [Hymenobacter sp. BRD128]QKG58407.1 DUF4271 domain-containing protein [Hymenobacter sp. BRD128]